ncbi:MAG: DUF4349 domain-containing protein [Bacteroidota bacterium]
MMMKNVGLICLLLMLYSCHGESSYGAMQAEASSKEAAYYEDQAQAANDDLATVDRKIIKTAEIRFQVIDLKASTSRIEQITKAQKGLISSMDQSNSSYSISNSLTIRIPAEKLEVFLLEIEKESIYTNYTRVHSQDVTEEYLDISIRLQTKKEVRDRYIEILRKQAKTVKDILDAEEKIRVIQEEIESIEGRLKFLKNKTSMSTVNIEIYQKVEYVQSPAVYQKPFFVKVKEGLFNGWNLIQDILIGLINIWPILLILILVLTMRKRIWGFFKR